MIELLKATYAGFTRHKSPWLAAAMSYFTIFAIAPLVIVLIEIAALAVGNDVTARKEVYAYIAQHSTGSSGTAIRGMVDATLGQRRQGMIAQVIGWTVFVFAAVGLFASLRDALDTIWDVQPKSRGFIGIIFQEAISFFVMLGIALLLIVSVVASAALTAAPGSKVIAFFVSFAVIAAAFAVLFRFLPAAKIEWRDVWAGAALTSLLFVIGQFLLAWYLGRAGTVSVFGAAGALVIFLMWVNYSAQIVLFGAEFTHEHSTLRRRA